MRFLLLLSFALSALIPVAGTAGTLADLGDLNVGSERLARWYPADQAELGYIAAREWPEYDVTCENAPCPSGRASFRDAPNLTAHAVVNPSNEEWWDDLNDMIRDAPDFSVLYLPEGTYDMGIEPADQVVRISRSNIVLRGAGIDKTHLRIAHIFGGQAVRGSAPCSDSDYPSNTNCGAGVVSVGTEYEGSAVEWDAGFSSETTVVTVSDASSFDPNGWLFLEIDDAASACNIILPEPAQDPKNTDHALGHISKIVSISGNQITIDRGLRMDFTIDPGCTTNAKARPYHPIRWVGLEGLHLTSSPSISQDDIKNIPLVSFGAGTVESWAVGNRFNRAEARIFQFRVSARNWLQGNFIEDYGRIDSHYNTTGVINQSGASDNVIENNSFRDYVVAIQNHQGSEGVVAAYNYMRFGNPPNSPEKSVFNHGQYTREILFEGNDVDGRMMTADHWWGTNGPRTTAFRNRVVGTGKDSQINVNRDKSGDWIITDMLNWIGNTSYYYMADPECVNGFPDCLNSSLDFDGTGTISTPRVTNMHVEKNMYRNTGTCIGDPTPGRCGFHQDNSNSDTSCGTADGPDDCEGGTGSNAGGNKAPGSWSGDNIPHSLYRLGSEPPIWWCEEACSWTDVHNGIGAWGDDFDVPLCKLPAQIMYEGGQCTLADGPAPPLPPDTLEAPFLLEE